MAVLIDRDDLIKELKKDGFHLPEWFENVINNQPTVEAKAVVHGEWVDVTVCLDSIRQYACSRCGNRPLYNFFGNFMISNYCHFCGADMRKKVNDD